MLNIEEPIQILKTKTVIDDNEYISIITLYDIDNPEQEYMIVSKGDEADKICSNTKIIYQHPLNLPFFKDKIFMVKDVRLIKEHFVDIEEKRLVLSDA